MAGKHMRWVTRKLRDVADFHLGKMLDQKKNRGEPLPYLANVNVRWGQFDLSDLRMMRFEHHERERYGLKYGDIVMCEGGEPGRCAIWKDQRTDMMYQKALHRIRAYAGILPDFLYYWFLHKGRTGHLAGFFTGSTIKHLPKEKLALVDVAVPPLGEQKRIASTLSAYDDLIENNRRRIQWLKQAARLLYREWFVHLRFPGHEHVRIVDGVPEGWERVNVFDAVDIQSGGTPKTAVPEYWDGDIPFFTPKDALNSVYVWKTEKSITDQGLRNCNSRLFPKDTVFITARGTVGKVVLAQRRMAMNQSCYALVPRSPLDPYFLYFALQAGIQQVRSKAVGAVFDAIIRDTFKLIPLVVPNPENLSRYSDEITPIVNQIDLLLQQNHRLAQARDLLLPRLMNGEIAV